MCRFELLSMLTKKLKSLWAPAGTGRDAKSNLSSQNHQRVLILSDPLAIASPFAANPRGQRGARFDSRMESGRFQFATNR